MSGWLFRLEIDLGDGAIHNEEAATAILTRIFRPWKNGKTTRLQKLVQDTLLDLPSEPGKWSEEQWQCAREICATDKEFQERSAVVTASQLNDEGLLRESRAIGQNADAVLIIDGDNILIDKNRRGPRDVAVPVNLRGDISRFE